MPSQVARESGKNTPPFPKKAQKNNCSRFFAESSGQFITALISRY
jgi:hypothetical protein